jgi:hypothetical protein
VLEDARKAEHSIYVAITVPNFAAPKEWDEHLADYLKKQKSETNNEVT